MSKTESKSRSSASHRLHAMDSFAEFVVTTGGFTVLAAVLGICLYLVWVVLPLFAKGNVGDGGASSVQGINQIQELVLDPYSQSATVVDEMFRANVFLTRTGELVGNNEIYETELAPSAMSFARNGRFVSMGFANGTIQLGELGYSTKNTILDDLDQERAIKAINEHTDIEDSHSVSSHEGVDWSQVKLRSDEFGYLEFLDESRGRQVLFEQAFDQPVELKEGAGPVLAIDYRQDPTGKKIVATIREDGTVSVNKVRTIRPLGGGAVRTKLSTKSFVLQRPTDIPDWFLVTADSKHVLCIWKSGQCERYSQGKDRSFAYMERFELIEKGGEISEVTMLLGGQTVLVGQTDGSVSAFHVAKDKKKSFDDEMMLVRSHEFRSSDGAIVSIEPSVRDRSVVILHASGVTKIVHMTSEKEVISFDSEIENPMHAVMSPKNNGVLIFGADGQFSYRQIDPGYPEFSVQALFGRVHYEGVAEPEYVYQSSSGDDASEIKLSLTPLIFGTLKATVFAMIFAIPIAILAAIYSSEFVSKRVRKKIKPTVELMASLPSVVLGFIAAMVVAPFVAQYLEAFIIGLIMIPLVVLAAAHFWQLVPLAYRLRTRSGHHLLFIGIAVLAGIGISRVIGPPMIGNWFSPDSFDAALFAGAVEEVPEAELPSWAYDAGYNQRTVRRLRNQEIVYEGGEFLRASDQGDYSAELQELGLASGDLQRWLNNEYGKAHAGWLVVFFPGACLIVWVLQAFLVRRKIDLMISELTGFAGNVVVLGKFVVLLIVSFVFAYVGALIAQSSGFDPRDSVFGSFSPRNTLVVSIIMGFAVIPIIYTISEDALQAVPMTLRTASLGAGATPWQTATRVVLPVAASGMFSACMIGFGRAVGETMIVLMATGNTPEMDWNIFAGFRTLAANIAVELPEAPKDETHYRVLFLCGLVLFVMTFIINTLAEAVRRVVRARNAGL